MACPTLQEHMVSLMTWEIEMLISASDAQRNACIRLKDQSSQDEIDDWHNLSSRLIYILNAANRKD